MCDNVQEWTSMAKTMIINSNMILRYVDNSSFDYEIGLGIVSSHETSCIMQIIVSSPILKLKTQNS